MDALQPFDSNACNRHLDNALLAERRGRQPVEIFRLRPSCGSGRSDKHPARCRWATGRATAGTEMPVHIMKCSHAAGRSREWATDKLIPDTQLTALTAASVRAGMVSVVKASLTKRQGAPTMHIPILRRKEYGVKHAIRPVTAIVFSRCPLCEAP
jgi:hypothetical protein